LKYNQDSHSSKMASSTFSKSRILLASYTPPVREIVFRKPVSQHQSKFWSYGRDTRLLSTLSYESLLSRNDEDKPRRHQAFDMISIRSFSTVGTKNLRERAVDRARDLKDRATNDPRGLAKAGAKSSYAKLKQYGPVFIGTYASIYLVTLCGLYIGVDTGTVDPVTLFSYLQDGGGIKESQSTADLVISYLQNYSWTRPAVPFLERNPHFANLGVAWVATKLTEPIRLVVTMGIVPKLADYLGYVPHVEEIQQEGNDIVKAEEVYLKNQSDENLPKKE
jgi:Protein of unknown function (DUF1279)